MASYYLSSEESLVNNGVLPSQWSLSSEYKNKFKKAFQTALAMKTIAR